MKPQPPLTDDFSTRLCFSPFSLSGIQRARRPVLAVRLPAIAIHPNPRLGLQKHTQRESCRGRVTAGYPMPSTPPLYISPRVSWPGAGMFRFPVNRIHGSRNPEYQNQGATRETKCNPGRCLQPFGLLVGRAPANHYRSAPPSQLTNLLNFFCPVSWLTRNPDSGSKSLPAS